MSLVDVPTFSDVTLGKSGSRPSRRRASGRNIKLEIEYDGTNYCGWQTQKSHHVTRSPRYHSKTIQEAIEKTLRKILQEDIKLIASGRTDAGVHAQAQVANFLTKRNIALEKLQRALNGNLPEDIVIKKVEEVALDFHSRFNARAKVYRYTILNWRYPSALLGKRVYFYPYPLDIDLMRQGSRYLLGRHDFRAFCASGSSVKDTVRTIKHISIKQLPYNLPPITYNLKERPLIIIDIEADGFLYNMVRSIVGTLIELGRGKLPKGRLRKILSSRDRKLAGPTVPACGLCLMRVKYK